MMSEEAGERKKGRTHAASSPTATASVASSLAIHTLRGLCGNARTYVLLTLLMT